MDAWLKLFKHPFSITAQQHPYKQTSPAGWVPLVDAPKTTAHLPLPNPVSTLQRKGMLGIFPGRIPGWCQLKALCQGQLVPPHLQAAQHGDSPSPSRLSGHLAHSNCSAVIRLQSETKQWPLTGGAGGQLVKLCSCTAPQ